MSAPKTLTLDGVAATFTGLGKTLLLQGALRHPFGYAVFKRPVSLDEQCRDSPDDAKSVIIISLGAPGGIPVAQATWKKFVAALKPDFAVVVVDSTIRKVTKQAGESMSVSQAAEAAKHVEPVDALVVQVYTLDGHRHVVVEYKHMPGGDIVFGEATILPAPAVDGWDPYR